MTKKLSDEEREAVAIRLCQGLNNAYEEFRNTPSPDCPDLVGLRYLAAIYKKCGMPTRSREILLEVNKLTECQKCVPSGGIIESVDQSLATDGGTHETLSPVQDPIPVDLPARVDSLQPG